MNKLQEIVAKRLEELNLGPVEAAVAGGLERTYIRDLVKEKKQTVNADKMPKLARALKLDPEALARNEAIPMDKVVKAATRVSVPNASFPPVYQKFPGDTSIPLLGRTAGGPNGRFILNGAEIGQIFCPPMLVGVEGAYALQVFGTSMVPRFRPGEYVWLNPHVPIRAEDDVVAQILTDGEEFPIESYIKEFRSQNSKSLRLWQHNPDEGETNEIEFDATHVFSVHKVVYHAAL